MPPLVAGAIAGAAIAFGGTITALSIVLGIATFALSAISMFLAPNVGSFEQRLQGLLTTQRSAIAYGRRIFGLTRVGGVITFLEVTDVPETETVWEEYEPTRPWGGFQFPTVITPGEDFVENGYLHMVITFAYHPIQEFLTVFFDDYPIHLRYLTEEGWVISGLYGNKDDRRYSDGEYVNSSVRIQVDNGVLPINGRVANDGLYGRADLPESVGYPGYVDEADWQPFPRLQAEVSGWTIDHKQLGRAKIYIRLKADRDLFPNGVPNITAALKGTKATDPRDSVNRWTPNPSVLMHHLIKATPSFACGLGALEDEVDDDSFVAAANVFDERVGVESSRFVQGRTFNMVTDSDVVRIDTSDNRYRYFPVYFTDNDGNPLPNSADLQTGDGVIFGGGQEQYPVGLTVGTKYYVILKTLGQAPTFDPSRAKVLGPDPDDRNVQGYYEGRAMMKECWTIGLATTYENAVNDVPIACTAEVSTWGSGQLVTIPGYKVDEARYQCSGVFEYDRPFADILDEMRSSCGASLVLAEGKYRLTSYAYTTPVYEITKDDYISEPQFTTKLSRRERFNVVTGVYSSPVHNFQPTAYPKTYRQQYIDDDNFTGEEAGQYQITRTIDLPFTTSPTAAQRLARMYLERARQEISGTIMVGLRLGLKLTVGDTIKITDDDMGWDEKVFEINEWEFAVTEDKQGEPVCVVSLVVKEHASAIFDWTPSTDESTLPSDLAQNTSLSSGLIVAPPTNLQVAEDIYQINGGIGLAARAVITWTASVSAYIHSYEVQFKKSDASEYESLAPTTTTQATLNGTEPATYNFRVRTISTLGVRSLWVEVDKEILGLSPPTIAPQNVALAQLSDALVLLTWDRSTELSVLFGGSVIIRHDEDDFSGDVINSVGIGSKVFPGNATSAVVPNKTGTYVILFKDSENNYTDATYVAHLRADTLAYSTLATITESTAFSGSKSNLQVIAGELQLAYDTDTSPSYDVVGSGLYTFAGSWSSGTAKNIRITTYIDVIIQDNLQSIDDRTEPIDEWPTMDGVLGIEADARVRCRLKLGDPASSPTPVYGDMQNVDCLIANAHEASFEVVVTSDFGYANIKIGTLYILIEEIL